MPKYGHLESTDPPIVAFYDTDALHYPSLPSDLVELSDEDWALRLTGSRWTLAGGRLVAVPPSAEQAAGNAVRAAIDAGIEIHSASNSTITGFYALDSQTLDQIGAVARDYAAGLGLPGGLGGFSYPDKAGLMRQFTGPELVAVYQAMRNLIFQIQTQGAIMRRGGEPEWPSNIVSIA